ncbi:hypothetical protein SAMD00023353_0201640 [Rosellinia necatrix]|uniref:Nephrocystin 3-like N-terminal domain-containing protein n=1 Tax=Rosellinia necatrix TaxID=77044 RepID=A0A1S8A508_ROSNE|nr:hypothetical protein SAMD00023353_0201640 [Rosellinia necatrix]
MRNKLLNALSPRPVGLVHDHLSKVRVKDSGDWVFDLPMYKAWHEVTLDPLVGAEGGENCLWLQGNLGAGKTMLM